MRQTRKAPPSLAQNLVSHFGADVYSRTYVVASDDARDREQESNGTGWQGMADRLDAVGGELDVTSAPGTGTTVLGRVPTTGAAR